MFLCSFDPRVDFNPVFVEIELKPAPEIIHEITIDSSDENFYIPSTFCVEIFEKP